MSTRYYSSSSICSCPSPRSLDTSFSLVPFRASAALSFPLSSSFAVHVLYTRSLDPLSLTLVLSIRSAFVLPSAILLGRRARALSLSLPRSFSFLRSHRPSPSSFVLLSLYPPLGSFLTLQPAAFPVPVSALLPRDSRIGSRSASVCARACTCGTAWMCVRVALFLACTFHGPVPPLRVSPASSPLSFPPSTRLFLSTASRSFSVSVQLTWSLSRPSRDRSSAAGLRSVVCPGVHETRERLGRGEFAFHRKALAGIGIYRGMERASGA